MLNKIILVVFFISVLYCGMSYAEDSFPFAGEINSEGINMRSDATVASTEICHLQKKTRVEVIRESYGWYKVRLPQDVPCYINKDMADCIVTSQPGTGQAQINKECQTVRVIRDNVNLRLSPTQSSPILGRAEKGEILTVIKETGSWYKVSGAKNAFGWINKRFVTRILPKQESGR